MKPTTAKEAVNALLSHQGALGASELNVQFHEIDDAGCTISFTTEDSQSLKVQIWADPKFEDLLHLACPLIQLKDVDLNKSQILGEDALFAYLTDRHGKQLALVHSLDTKAGFALETVVGVAWALSVYSEAPAELLKKEKP
jgi:hypothetical protein